MQPLFTHPFPATDKTAWQAQVRKELNDENAEDGLRWYPDGPSQPQPFVVEPYYVADELSTLPLAVIQAAQKPVPGWLNAPAYTLTANEKADNTALRDVLTRGADALVLTIPHQYSPNKSLRQLLDGVKLSDTPIFFRTDTADATTFATALKTVAPYQLKGGLLTDMGVGTAEATRLTADSPRFRTVCASSHAFHNAGATATQELAFTLARLADAYDELTDSGLTIDQLIPKTMLSVSVGTSYFMEIAKLRALRVLIVRFLSYYPTDAVHPLFIHAQTSAFYNASVSPYTNQIRATTEAMAAAVGGCDALTVHPYDAVFGERNELSARIARNVSVLLTEESYFDKVADPSAGSYYIETLTHQLTEAAWALFLRVEAVGGFGKAFAQGFIQTEIERAYQAKVDAIRNGKVLVGVTKFQFNENNTDNPEKLAGEVTSFLPNRRLAEEFE